jgi:hypothetical protein
MTYTRRDWIRSAAIGALGILISRRALAESAGGAPLAITVYKSATCGCCKEWVTHLSKNGFAPRVHDLPDSKLAETKAAMGVPPALESCHTALIGRYVIEGHVPADLIKKLVAGKSTTILGLAVPGMPVGSPGMEMGSRKDPYDVIAFTRDGKRSVYAKR